MANDDELIKRAECVKERINASRNLGEQQEQFSLPFFVEFAGTPKSGKSSCIEIVRHFFRRVGSVSLRLLKVLQGALRTTLRMTFPLSTHGRRAMR